MFSFWVRHLFEGGELLKTVDYFLVERKERLELKVTEKHSRENTVPAIKV